MTAHLRRGLPRVAGGEPWPPASAGDSQHTLNAAQAAAGEEPTQPLREGQTKVADIAVAEKPKTSQQPLAQGDAMALRRGLPRVAGGEPWPNVGVAPERTHTAQASTHLISETVAVPPPVAEPAPVVEAAPVSELTSSTTSVAEPAPPSPASSTPALAAEGATATQAPSLPSEPAQRRLTRSARTVVAWMFAAIAAAGIIVLAARGVTTLPGVPEFLQRYPGETPLPEFVEPGFAPWVRWSHFLNFFFMVLIIRSGLLVRHQQKPDAYFTPKNSDKKVSIYLWLHTSIDVLWLLNGIAFVVLLFVTGHWARIVPTSWEVVPNALSAALQYLTLQWPQENGWVNYNSLQQLMYFVVVFVAAPLAALTGIRMSRWWPENASRLNAWYPAPIARAIHYPVMLFFVMFVIVHVFLVLTTGALKNLNHMFAGTDQISWVGFWLFAASVLVTAVVTWAARPLVLAPIAQLFGKVSER